MRNAALVLQLELGSIESQTAFVMVNLSDRLMVPPKERPGHHLSMLNDLLPHQRPDKAKHFWKGVRDQWTTNPLWHLNCCKLLGLDCCSHAFFSRAVLACSTIIVAHNWATSESVTCRYHPVQEGTSY